MLTAMMGSQTEIGNVTVRREGDQIILPKGMTTEAAITWLRRQQEMEDKTVKIHHCIPCMPLDGMYALWEAFQEVYGFTDLRGDRTMFGGEQPPNIVRIDTGANGECVQVPYCKIIPPPWGGGWMQPFINNGTSLNIIGEVKKKHEDEVKRIVALTERKVRENSIYKGKAFAVDLSWMPRVEAGHIHFDPTKHKPEFLDLTEVDEETLILNETTQHQLETALLLRIKRPEACRANGIEIKSGMLAAGPYGTGKSTTGMVVGAVAERNGYTFIYCKSVEQVTQGMELARMHAPAVFFCEDINEIVSGERNAEMNAVLEAIDGIEAKGKEVIYVFTTNFVEKINPAFLRPGRIDNLIHFGLPDASTAARFVQRFTITDDGQSLLAPGADMEVIGKATEKNAPAAITEIVKSAKARAMLREGDNIIGKLTHEDIRIAAHSKAEHLKLTQDKDGITNAEALRIAKEIVSDHEHGTILLTEQFNREDRIR